MLFAVLIFGTPTDEVKNEASVVQLQHKVRDTIPCDSQVHLLEHASSARDTHVATPSRSRANGTGGLQLYFDQH